MFRPVSTSRTCHSCQSEPPDATAYARFFPSREIAVPVRATVPSFERPFGSSSTRGAAPSRSRTYRTRLVLEAVVVGIEKASAFPHRRREALVVPEPREPVPDRGALGDGVQKGARHRVFRVDPRARRRRVRVLERAEGIADLGPVVVVHLRGARCLRIGGPGGGVRRRKAPCREKVEGKAQREGPEPGVMHLRDPTVTARLYHRGHASNDRDPQVRRDVAGRRFPDPQRRPPPRRGRAEGAPSWPSRRPWEA